MRGEIGAFGWHFVSSLPASEEATMQYNTAEGAKHKFYQVTGQAQAMAFVRLCCILQCCRGLMTWER